MKYFILILFIFISNSYTQAQGRLQKLYEKGKYDRCIKLADRNRDKKKDVPISLLYKAKCLLLVPETQYADEFRRPHRDAMLSIYLIRSRNEAFFFEHEAEINRIVKVADKTADSLLNTDNKRNYRKASGIYRYLNKTFPEKAGFYFDLLHCEQKSESVFSPEYLFDDLDMVENLSGKMKQIDIVVTKTEKLAEEAFKNKNFEHAAEFYHLMTQFQPQNINAYFGKAQSYLKLGDEENFEIETNKIWGFIDEAPEEEAVEMYIEYSNLLHENHCHKKLFGLISSVKDTISTEYNRHKSLWGDLLPSLYGDSDTITVYTKRFKDDNTFVEEQKHLIKKRAHHLSKIEAIDLQNKISLLWVIQAITENYNHKKDLPLLYEVSKFKETYYPDFKKFDRQLSKVIHTCTHNCGLTETEKRKMLAEVNRNRSKQRTCGSEVMPAAPPLQWDDCVEAAAQLHADDMNTYNFYSHDSPNGYSHWDRGLLLGCDYLGENIASGPGSVEQLVKLWMRSSGHCKNIMNPNYTKFGAGRSENKWVQNFKR